MSFIFILAILLYLTVIPLHPGHSTVHHLRGISPLSGHSTFFHCHSLATYYVLISYGHVIPWFLGLSTLSHSHCSASCPFHLIYGHASVNSYFIFRSLFCILATPSYLLVIPKHLDPSTPSTGYSLISGHSTSSNSHSLTS